MTATSAACREPNLVTVRAAILHARPAVVHVPAPCRCGLNTAFVRHKLYEHIRPEDERIHTIADRQWTVDVASRAVKRPLGRALMNSSEARWTPWGFERYVSRVVSRSAKFRATFEQLGDGRWTTALIALFAECCHPIGQNGIRRLRISTVLNR